MRLSDVLDQVRLSVEDKSSAHWGDDTIIRQVDVQTYRIARRLVDVDEGYLSVRLDIDATAAIARHTNVFTYKLPWWSMKVAEVRERGTTNQARGRLIRKGYKFDEDEPGRWRYTDKNAISLEGFSAAQDLSLVIAKRPARLTRGTLPDQASITTSQLRLDVDTSTDALKHPHEKEANSYAGSLFEITGLDSATHLVSGQIRQAASSAHLQVFGSTIHTVLTFEEAWTVTPIAADTYEMHAEVPDEHMRLVVLLTASALLSHEGNKDAVAGLGRELSEEWRLFITHVNNRDIQEPKVMVESYGGSSSAQRQYRSLEES